MVLYSFFVSNTDRQTMAYLILCRVLSRPWTDRQTLLAPKIWRLFDSLKVVDCQQTQSQAKVQIKEEDGICPICKETRISHSPKTKIPLATANSTKNMIRRFVSTDDLRNFFAEAIHPNCYFKHQHDFYMNFCKKRGMACSYLKFSCNYIFNSMEAYILPFCHSMPETIFRIKSLGTFHWLWLSWNDEFWFLDARFVSCTRPNWKYIFSPGTKTSKFSTINWIDNFRLTYPFKCSLWRQAILK